ncbi:MAG: hypothetical protein KDI46_00745 [Alphaproteobacteria bacterium]|nr:hypothetical protein [Alphaproteobacteria bacterium]
MDTFICDTDHVILPVPPETGDTEMDRVYERFVRHMRCVPNSRLSIKILSSIQFTADLLGYSDAHVAKLLMDLGLRAPRSAFPAEFLRFADQALMRSGWDVGGPSESLLDLKRFWDRIGEDRFSAFKVDYPLLSEHAVF